MPVEKQEGPHAGQLLLLKGITGSFRPRVLTALMGASGAGKTTLMVGRPALLRAWVGEIAGREGEGRDSQLWGKCMRCDLG